MNTVIEQEITDIRPLSLYHEILLAVDSSDHSNRGVEDGVELAKLSTARITAAHVYAAQMHDLRFRQMEGGLPEKFREEQELERQRDVHDDLITRGLSIIADSYMDQVDRITRKAGVRFARRALEGKNYRQMVSEANRGDYDLLVLGALGLGAVAESTLGTVCERVVRRCQIDSLVIKSPTQSIAEGPIVVAIDGSSRAYGGLLTALALAQKWQVAVHVVSAFDPYYHYVAFNRIAGVLSEEAGKVFRFQDQERLHEEIIDSGLAKIYAGHLEIARSIADDYAVPVETRLLDGKPHDVIMRYVREKKPSLLIAGKLGIHADDDLDIGGNAENLLRQAPCAVLLSQREFQPQIERIADVTVSWTHEAKARLKRAPDFVQNMARMAILRYAQEKGHTVVTERIVEEATASLMPGRANQAMAEIVSAHDAAELERSQLASPMRWSDEARGRLEQIVDPSLRDHLRLRAEKKARGARASEVGLNHVLDFLDGEEAPVENNTETESGNEDLYWQADALARLARVPEGFMREACQQRIESRAHEDGVTRIDLARVETGIGSARDVMLQQQGQEEAEKTAPKGQQSRCPFAQQSTPVSSESTSSSQINWTAEAQARLEEVPAGYCRTLTQRCVLTLAQQEQLKQVDLEFLERVLKVFQQGSGGVHTSMRWSAKAQSRIARAPESVRGMLVREIESWAQREGLERVNQKAVRAIKREWQERGVFHLDPGDPRSDN